jgi:hypothetical protein
MTEDELINRYPVLWHMAEDGSWPGIRQYGLLSTTALLDLYNIAGDRREQLESQRRPHLVALRQDGMPQAIIRDQKPMNDTALQRYLQDGLTPQDWYRILNAKAFFWVCRKRLGTMLHARAYRGTPQIVLSVDTAGLLQANRDHVRLSPINSGATPRWPQPRGLATFRRVAEFPHDEIRRKRSGRDAVVEFVIEHGVPDIVAHVLTVERIYAGRSTMIWQRPLEARHGAGDLVTQSANPPRTIGMDAAEIRCRPSPVRRIPTA